MRKECYGSFLSAVSADLHSYNNNAATSSLYLSTV